MVSNVLSNPRRVDVKSESTKLKVLPVDVQNLALDLHNEYRRKHGSPPVELDDRLCSEAQRFVQCILTNGHIESDTEIELMGRNLCRLFGPVDPKSAIRKAMTTWYSKKEEYNWDNPLTSGQAAKQFAQIIWDSCTTIGLGVGAVGTKTVVMVLYSPPGDMTSEREHRDNVRSILAANFDRRISRAGQGRGHERAN